MCDHTSRVTAKDEFSDLIVNKNKETVRERTEPPAGPEGEQREEGRAALESKRGKRDEEHGTC